MSARRYALLAALALFIAFIASNVIANSWFRSWRLDLTENHLYSISRGTQETLNQLTEPVQLTLYYSRNAAQPVPQLQAYAARVREMLQTFQARSHGRVRFTEVNVEPFTEAEDQASEAGVQAVRPYEGADPIYFGLVGANAIDDTRVIPLFDPQRESFLEYELTRIIYELENPERTHIALITSLPIDPAAAGGRAGSQSVFATEMGRVLDVTKLAPDFTAIPAKTDVLAIIHPGALTPAQLYAIDQFILRRGRAFIALDPASMQAAMSGSAGFDPFNPVLPAPTASTLEPLLGAWGVAMAPTVVLDQEGALPVSVQDPQTGQTSQAPQPLFFQVPAETGLDREDLMTAWLRRGINFGLAGGLTRRTQLEGVTFTPLIRTSGRTMRMPAEQALARPSPMEVFSMWPPSGGRRENVAVRLSGNLTTAFPDGPPSADEVDAPEAAPSDQPAAPTQAAPQAEQLRTSATPAEIVIVADTDFLADDFYVDPQSGGTAADNASFALNAIDVLGGSDALVSLRSRAPAERKMKLIDDMERAAQRRIESEQRRLEGELQETQTRLQQLQAHGRGSGFFAGDLGAELTPEEQTEVERFRERETQIRADLRGLARDLRGDIE
ncbi:MAG: Gldg family protein, partial [Hyphomonadaceae bacterium]|nr:Gldg family protein [Hyphomonadaceae bacterium]